jgi:CSLREA domain-containing protein
MIENGTVVIDGCTISDNNTYLGGGFAIERGHFTMRNSTIARNIATGGIGGGFLNLSSTLIVENCTISNNKAYYRNNSWGGTGGGGIAGRVADSNIIVSNSTITENSGNYGGGILNLGSLAMNNTIVAGNTLLEGDGRDVFALGYYGGYTTMSGGYNLIQDQQFLIFEETTNILGVAAQLGPLRDNGGPSHTHALISGSPAIDAGDPNQNITSNPYDQRGVGFPRVLNGRSCIGAFEPDVSQTGTNFVVNVLDDRDDGVAGTNHCTLREAIRYAPDGATITFSVAGTITLAGVEMVIGKNLSIIGPSDAPGITLSGNNQSRIFSINSAVSVSHLNFTAGNGIGASFSASGGAISIDASRSLNVSNCSFYANSVTGSSGAIRNAGTLNITNSTLHSNSAGAGGGAIRSGGTMVMINCTVTNNSCPGSLGGGGIYTLGNLTLYNSILAGNTAAEGPNLFNTAGNVDYNLIEDTTDSTLSGSNNIVGQSPNLGALAANGGSTRSLALLAGSPAIGAGSNELIPAGVVLDQRGSARIEGGTVDMGAFELDTTLPTLTISGPSQNNAASGSSIEFQLTYSDSNFSHSTLAIESVVMTPTGTASASVGLDSGSGSVRTVTLSEFTGEGSLTITIAAGTGYDRSGNAAPSAGPSDPVVVNATRPAVTINQGSNQTDPTTLATVSFTVHFSQSVDDFTSDDVSLDGSAGASSAIVTGSGNSYEVAISGMTRSGTVIATIEAGVATDAFGNGNLASTSTDNSVHYFSPQQVRSSGTITKSPGGGFDISFLGNPGTEYTIEYSPDLTPDSWLPLRDQTANGLGKILINDNPPPGTPKRFYRLIME